MLGHSTRGSRNPSSFSVIFPFHTHSFLCCWPLCKDVILLKKREPGEKCHSRTMIHSETGDSSKMNTHHVSRRQSVEEIRLGKEWNRWDRVKEARERYERPCR